MESNVFEKLGQITESYFCNIRSIVEGTYVTESDDGDGKIESKEELKSYAMTLAKKAFGDDVDASKVNGIVDKAIKDSKGNWETAAGMVTGSFNESVEETDKDDSEDDVCSECEKEPCECDKEEVTEDKDSEDEDEDSEDEDEDSEDKDEDSED